MSGDRLTEHKPDPASPPAQARLRLGLPSVFLWQAPDELARLLEKAKLSS